VNIELLIKYKTKIREIYLKLKKCSFGFSGGFCFESQSTFGIANLVKNVLFLTLLLKYIFFSKKPGLTV
ncbi:MAG: hypothetical protein ABL876_07210, partial [Chitinophagaceae bacterium]